MSTYEPGQRVALEWGGIGTVVSERHPLVVIETPSGRANINASVVRTIREAIDHHAVVLESLVREAGHEMPQGFWVAMQEAATAAHRADEVRAIAASLERQDAFFRNHARTEATS